MGFLNPNYDSYAGVAPTGVATPNGVTYGGSVSNDGLPGASDNPANFLDNTIGPDYVDYPLPAVTDYSTRSASGASCTSTPGSSPPTMAVELRVVGSSDAGAAPVQVAVVSPNTPPSTEPSGGSTVPPPSSSGATIPPSGGTTSPPTGSAPSAATAAATLPQLASAAAPAAAAAVTTATAKFQRAYSFNPAFEAEPHEGKRKSTDEQHVTRDALPVSFTVPDGCNAVDLWFGPIEPAPGARSQDWQHVIQTSKARVVDADAGGELDEQSLQPGQLMAVIVPWRVAATARIDAGRLRMAVMAHFYALAPQ